MGRYFSKVKLLDSFQIFSINYFALLTQFLKYFGTFDLKRIYVDFSWKCFDKLVSVSLISTSAQVPVVKQHLKEVSEVYCLLVLHRYLFKLVDKHEPKGCNIFFSFLISSSDFVRFGQFHATCKCHQFLLFILQIKLTNQRAIYSEHKSLVASGFKTLESRYIHHSPLIKSK